jgi:two-component system NarL family response regulator
MAADGQEAIQAIEEDQPDILLMDVHMPGMNGLEVTRLIKARWPGIKVVLLTMSRLRPEEIVASGADAWVSKLQSPDRLLNTLKQVRLDLVRGVAERIEAGFD